MNVRTKTTRLIALAVSHFNQIDHALARAVKLYPPEAIVLEGRWLDVQALSRKGPAREEYALRHESARRTLDKWDSEEEYMVRFQIEDLRLFHEDVCLYGGASLEDNEAYKFALREGVPVYHPEQLWYKKNADGTFTDLGIPRILMDKLTAYPYGIRPGPQDNSSPLNTDGLTILDRNEIVGEFIDHIIAAEGYGTVLLIMGTRHFNFAYQTYMTPEQRLFPFPADQHRHVQDFTAVDQITIVDTNQPGFVPYTIRG
jgi:hypothetical protein